MPLSIFDREICLLTSEYVDKWSGQYRYWNLNLSRENVRSITLLSLYHSLYRFSIPIYKDTCYRRYRERDLFSPYTRYISLPVTESDSTESKAVIPLSVSFTASIHDAFVTHHEDVSNFRILSRTAWPFGEYASYSCVVEYFLVIFRFDIEQCVHIMIWIF